MARSEPDNVIELESADSLAEVLSSLGGPTVDDTEIRYTDGDGVVSVGGLEITWPVLEELDYYAESGRNITVPPSWPTLNTLGLASHRDPSGDPSIGLAVFKQVTLVTDDDSRQQLFDTYWTKARFADAEVTHQSEMTNDDTGVTCWTEVRYGQVREGFEPEDQAVVLFAGPGIASSGIIIWAPGSFTEIPTITGDLVESVCGTRPTGCDDTFSTTRGCQRDASVMSAPFGCAATIRSRRRRRWAGAGRRRSGLFE